MSKSYEENERENEIEEIRDKPLTLRSFESIMEDHEDVYDRMNSMALALPFMTLAKLLDDGGSANTEIFITEMVKQERESKGGNFWRTVDRYWNCIEELYQELSEDFYKSSDD